MNLDPGPIPASSVLHYDVLIVGAGLSGVDAAYRLQSECPSKTYAILEARSAIGGTWDLFRYPGIRSDSDMSTLGFPFEPWDSDVSIAEGGAIRDYIERTARKYGIDRQIRFGHRVRSADWCSRNACWTVTCEVGGETRSFTCNFLYACSGYYDYAGGYLPQFPGIEAFAGRLVHPQQWPEGLEVAGKKIVVIGSGATAITLVPSLARAGAQVTMLQRSPTYVVPMPRRDALASWLQKRLPLSIAGTLTRWKNILLTMFFYQYARRRPQQTRQKILDLARKLTRNKVDIDRHFSPSYKPWDQRLCVVPDGDLFKDLREGRAAVVTDHIDRFTATGIRTRSGAEIPADIVVAATGLVVQLFGGATVSLDGVPVEPGKKMLYKGMMLDGVPNFAFAFGYTNASWTLKCDLTAQYVCRLLRHMEREGHDVCVPERGSDVAPEKMVDLNSGYIERALAIMPQQGSRAPWRVHQNYLLDLAATRLTSLQDGAMRFAKAGQASARRTAAASEASAAVR